MRAAEQIVIIGGVLGGAGKPFKPVPAILITDADSDCGDVTAIATAFQLHYLGYLRIDLIVASTRNDTTPPLLEMLRNYAALNSIPIACYQGSLATVDASSPFASNVYASASLQAVTGVVAGKTRANYPDAITSIRAQMETWRVASSKGRVLSIGGCVVEGLYLGSTADGNSALDGVSLTAAASDEWHLMGGNFPNGGFEANIKESIALANVVASTCPVPCYWHDVNEGNNIVNWFPTYADDTHDPFHASMTFNGDAPNKSRPSWDTMPILSSCYPAARPGGSIFNFTGPGTLSFSGTEGVTNSTSWSANPSGKHYYSRSNNDTSLTALCQAFLKSFTDRRDIYAPTINSTSFSNTELTQLAGVLSASETVTWSIVGGADAAQFAINGQNLTWVGDGTQSFTSPHDADGNNIYLVTVRATDTSGNHTDKALSVTVTAAHLSDIKNLANLNWYIDFNDTTKLWTTIGKATNVATTGDTVGYAADSSTAAFDMSALADDTSRPTWNSGGYATFDGSNDVLRRTAALGLYAGGACTIFGKFRGNPALGAAFYSEAKSGTGNNGFVRYLDSDSTTATSAGVLLRNDAGTFEVAAGGCLTPNAWNNADHSLIVTDDGSTVKTYLDGTLVATKAYTRSGTSTVDTTSIGATVRSQTPAGGSFFSMPRCYKIGSASRVISSAEISDLASLLT